MILTQSLALKLSKLFSGIVILISLVAFSGSVSANTDTRKTVNRETLAKRTHRGKKSISLQQARQQLVTADFIREVNLLAVIYSLPQLARLVRLRLCEQGKFKPDRSKIHSVLHLHAPRSADVLVNLS